MKVAFFANFVILLKLADFLTYYLKSYEYESQDVFICSSNPKFIFKLGVGASRSSLVGRSLENFDNFLHQGFVSQLNI